jgi:hypothetical protein
MRLITTTFAAVLATSSLALAGSPNRVWFQGSDAIAMASATGQSAGYAGLPAQADPNNLSANCPTCVPGGTADSNFGAGVPNQIVTFLHPYTNKAISVPLTLPVGKPRIVIQRSRIIYDYGLFKQKVVVNFFPEGLVEVVYRG